MNNPRKLEIGDKLLCKAQNGNPIKVTVTRVKKVGIFRRIEYTLTLDISMSDELILSENEMLYTPNLFDKKEYLEIPDSFEYCYDVETNRNIKIDEIIN